MGGVAEARQLLVADHVEAHLELQRGQDRGQVGVAAALAVAVDGALHQRRARFDRGERVGDRAAGVVVGVDADPGPVAERLDHGRGRLGDEGRQAAAVGVAERDVLGAGLGGGAQRTRSRSPGRRASRRRSARRRRRPASRASGRRRPSRRSSPGSPPASCGSPSRRAAPSSCRPDRRAGRRSPSAPPAPRRPRRRPPDAGSCRRRRSPPPAARARRGARRTRLPSGSRSGSRPRSHARRGGPTPRRPSTARRRRARGRGSPGRPARSCRRASPVPSSLPFGARSSRGLGSPRAQGSASR